MDCPKCGKELLLMTKVSEHWCQPPEEDEGEE